MRPMSARPAAPKGANAPLGGSATAQPCSVGASYPRPERNDFNAPMLDAWAHGKLCLQQCKACRYKVYFPRLQCPQCWSTELEWQTLSGRGKIVSFTIVHKHVHASFAQESPLVFAEILLEEGWPMLARVIAQAPAQVRTGMSVALVAAAQAGRFPLPTFQLCGGDRDRS